MKLDVYANSSMVGTLEQVDITSYVFRYVAGVTDDNAVSLLMRPSVKLEWEHRFLHPVFQVSLPEGVLRRVLTRAYAKQFTNFGDTELLATVGSHLVGRNKVAPAGAPLRNDAPTEHLQALLNKTSAEMFEHYLQTHAQYSGVSGGFPKFLAKSPLAQEANARSTLTFDHWIIKSPDDDHPGLAFNEYFGMRVAQLMELQTPELHASSDYSRVAIKRFDYDEAGCSLGFEDMCALNALNADQKFSGSVERVVKVINSFCQPKQAKEGRAQFFAQYLACMALRNGDAHLKNFGLLYSNTSDVRMAPVYDMVSMSAYAPRHPLSGDALDEPAMSLNGVRRWPDAKAIAYLASRCTVTARTAAEVVEALASAMLQASEEVVFAAESAVGCKPIAKRMLELWSHGLRLHAPDAAGVIAEKAASIEADKEPHHMLLTGIPPINHA